MSENKLNLNSGLVWALGIVSVIITTFISVNIAGIAKDARLGHDLAVKIENDQKSISAAFAAVGDKLERQSESSYRLREQFLLLDQSTKSMSELVQQQNLILQGLGNLSYKVEALEKKEDVPPWMTEQLRQHGAALNDLKNQLDELRKRVRQSLPKPPQAE